MNRSASTGAAGEDSGIRLAELVAAFSLATDLVNTFEISPDGDGSRVVYRSQQLRLREPAWGLRYPLLRNITYRIWIPIWSGRGFRNLLRMAEERSATTSPVDASGSRPARLDDH